MDQEHPRERESSVQPLASKWILHWNIIESSGFGLLLFIEFYVSYLDKGTGNKNSKSADVLKLKEQNNVMRCNFDLVSNWAMRGHLLIKKGK